MKNEEKLKQLKMALTKHKDLIADLGDNCKIKLTWDKCIDEYIGTSIQTGIHIGIWDLEFLFRMASGKISGASLEVYDEKE